MFDQKRLKHMQMFFQRDLEELNRVWSKAFTDESTIVFYSNTSVQSFTPGKFLTMINIYKVLIES